MHPEAPRTVWSHLRDDAPLPDGLDLSMPLRAHPTLTTLRARLGPHLDVSGLKSEYLWLRSAPDALSGVAARELTERLQRALRSDRDILIRIASDGVIQVDAPTTLGPFRQGEPTWAWVRVVNDGERAVPIRIGLGARTRGLRVPASGSRSFLYRVDSQRGGRVEVAAASSTSEVRIGLEVLVRPSWRLTLSLEDGPARLVVTDELGPVAPRDNAIRRDLHGDWYFHLERRVALDVVGEVHVQASRGLEYEPLRLRLRPDPAGARLARLRLSRRIDLAAQGWRSADLHAHLHYGGEYLLDTRDAALAQRAEGLWFLNLLVANQESGIVHDRSSFASSPVDGSGLITAWGEEFRNDFYGHVTLTDVGRLIEPVYSGFHGTEHASDFPSTVDTALRAREAGALVCSAHPVIFGDGIDEIFSRPRSAEAKELPVLAALGLVDAVDVMSYPGDADATMQLWYRLLDCGLRLAASAGSDAFMNVADGEAFMSGEAGVTPGSGGRFSSPPGGMRVYARVESADRSGLCAAIRAGRTFVTNGPFLGLDVEGAMPGGILDRGAHPTLTVSAWIASWVSVGSLDLVVNGRVARSTRLSSPPVEARTSWEVTLDEPAWIALRARGGSPREVMDDYVFAHTSPVYIDIEGRRVQRPESLHHFVRWVDRLSDELGKHARFERPWQERAVRAAYARARHFYADGAAG